MCLKHKNRNKKVDKSFIHFSLSFLLSEHMICKKSFVIMKTFDFQFLTYFLLVPFLMWLKFKAWMTIVSYWNRLYNKIYVNFPKVMAEKKHQKLKINLRLSKKLFSKKLLSSMLCTVFKQCFMKLSGTLLNNPVIGFSSFFHFF